MSREIELIKKGRIENLPRTLSYSYNTCPSEWQSLHHVGDTRYFCGVSALGITFYGIKFYRSFFDRESTSVDVELNKAPLTSYVCTSKISRRNLGETLTMDDDKPSRLRRPISAAANGCISRERDFQSRNKTLSWRESTILTLQ